MRFLGFKIGKSKEKPDKDKAGASNSRAAQAAVLEEHINNRTKDLEAAEQQLRKLASTATGAAKDEEAPPKPHGPLSELSVEPEDTPPDEETVATSAEPAKEEINVVKVKSVAAAPAEAAAKAEVKKVTADAGKDDSLTNLFNQDEDEVNPLANLINSLPDVTAQELLDDLREIKEIILESKPK